MQDKSSCFINAAEQAEGYVSEGNPELAIKIWNDFIHEYPDFAHAYVARA